jgi:predicted NAD-dependent protein-ADP-ribosyltransferase YbiA (DUF1768 family)
VFENSVSRKIFVYKRDEFVTSWRKFHNKNFKISTPHLKIKSRKIRWVRYLASVGDKRNAHKIRIVGIPGGKRALGRYKRGWEENIKMDPKIMCENMPNLAQRFPTGVNFSLLHRSRYFLEIAPQLSSRG